MNFFGMGPMEIVVIMLIALIIFGPGKLPEIGATVGKAVRDFRAATKDLSGEFTRTMQEVEAAAGEMKDSAREVQETTHQAVRLDQVVTPVTAPIRSSPPGVPSGPPPDLVHHPSEQASRVPTKDDPLADLMGSPEPDPSASNGQLVTESRERPSD